MQKLLPPVLFLLSVIIMTALHFASPVLRVVPPPLTWSGLLPLVAGLGIAAWHNRLFHKLETNIYTFDEPGRFVREGLFKHTRNPMYLGFVIALLGVFLLMGTLSPLLVVAAFILITDRWYIAFEERMMEEKFGEEYLAYKRAVRRWV